MLPNLTHNMAVPARLGLVFLLACTLMPGATSFVESFRQSAKASLLQTIRDGDDAAILAAVVSTTPNAPQHTYT